MPILPTITWFRSSFYAVSRPYKGMGASIARSNLFTHVGFNAQKGQLCFSFSMVID